MAPEDFGGLFSTGDNKQALSAKRQKKEQNHGDRALETTRVLDFSFAPNLLTGSKDFVMLLYAYIHN